MATFLVQRTLVQANGAADLVRILAVTVVCTLLAAAVVWLTGLGTGRPQVTAGARALVQLSLVGLLIAAVLRSWPLTVAFALLMTTVAGLTSGRRIWARWTLRAFPPILAGILPVVTLLLASRVVPLQPVAVVPVVGILIGNAMTATTLAGRRLHDAWQERYGEFEAALSVGLQHRDAAALVIKDDAGLALVPGMDQTRTVGLVTLPGAFVGVMLGGGSAVQAAAVQLVVLAALLLVQALAVVTIIEVIVREPAPTAQSPSQRPRL